MLCSSSCFIKYTWSCFQLVFLRKSAPENRFYYFPLQYLSHLYSCEGIWGICCYEHSGCSQRAQIIQSNSQLLHKRTSLLHLMRYVSLHHLMLAPIPVWCLRRQLKSQNQQKISPAKCPKHFCYLVPWIRLLQGQTCTNDSTGMGGGEELVQTVKHSHPLDS